MRRATSRNGTNVLLIALLTAALLTVPMVSAWPTPGFNGEEAREVTGRVFPEARQTNDFVSYQEARDGLLLLERENPELLEFVDIGPSRGWVHPASGEREPSQVFAVSVTDEESGVPEADRINILMQMSIHGNEKGGREGAFRVVEDFVLARQTGEDVGAATQERLAMLDRVRLIFAFPNPDGWTHEELEYRWNEACYVSATCDYASGNDQAGGAGAETQGFVRVNGNGTDLNRQAPVLGFVAKDHRTLAEPEVRAEFRWLKEEFHRIHYAADIHGMLDPADAGEDTSEPGVCADGGPLGRTCTREGHFVLGLLPASPQDPVKDMRVIELAARANLYVNQDPAFDWWRTLPPAGMVGGEVAAWGTVWDTIGYTDTGFTGDWMAQPHGLDAVGVYYEYAYNHLLFDNHYPGPGAEINRLHVAATRDIVAAFMDVAWEQSVRRDLPTVHTGGVEVGYVPTDVVRDPPTDARPTGSEGFDALEEPASLNAFFADVRATLDDPSLLRPVEPGALATELSDGGLDVLVVPGSAVERLGPDDVAAVQAFVESGGRLVVTDEALTLLVELGLDVDPQDATVFAGHTDPDRSHRLFRGVEGLARQLTEPVPLGFPPGVNSPQWSLDADAVRAEGGEVAGEGPGPGRAAIGVLPVGDGEAVFVGALLPDPHDEDHHPFGLAGYAVTYTGHQVFRNAVGWSAAQATVEPGSVPEDAGGQAVPAPGAWAVVAALVAAAGAAALVSRRRRRGD